ncbi:MAG: DUF1684 domain-containing protein [Bryobacterales bacterium]|nr:DUF1684 domain-containing protein [Bryobacterales bacterium]
MLRRDFLLASTAAAAFAQDPASNETWRKERLARLQADDGWLTLVGLHWLEEGDNTLASAPGYTFTRKGLNVTANGRALKPNDDQITLGTHTYFVIVRGDRVAIREKDTAAKTRREFHGLDYFPYRPEWRFEAKWKPYAKPITRRIANVAGTVDEYQAPGRAEFVAQGRKWTLEPVIEEDHLFYVFKDLTAGKSTYPAGRFIELPMPRDGRAIVDFNRAYNPPCAFTPYATCPLPPKHNHLALAIEAGEKSYHSE